jgi:hypothetical protein
MAATVLAGPMDQSQVTLNNRHNHAFSDAYPERAKFKTPFVAKMPMLPPDKANHRLRPAPVPKPPTPGKTSWLGGWKTQDTTMKSRIQKEGGRNCFCAGGSVCCTTLKEMDCNFGLCGI